MINVVDYWNNYKFRAPAVRIIRPAGKFTIKTAESIQEVRQALRLRYQVYWRELGGRENELELDLDEFDEQCSHLLIIDNDSARVIATYRLNCAQQLPVYSSSEFELDVMMGMPGNKLEIGRACVDREWRNRDGIFLLLWKGMFEFVVKTDTRFLYGVNSIPISCGREQLKQIHNYLSSSCRLSDMYGIRVRTAAEDPLAVLNEQEQASTRASADTIKIIPPPLPFYMWLGALVHGVPFFDKDYQCYDYFTMLDIKLNATPFCHRQIKNCLR